MFIADTARQGYRLPRLRSVRFSFKCAHVGLIQFVFCNRGLEEILRTGQVVEYPKVCAEATARFSVLSDTINVVLDTLRSQGFDEWTKLISKLQKAEKTKLSLTAALHLEQMRAASHVRVELSLGEGVASTGVSDLHQSDMRSLKQGIASLVTSINEVIEELRYASLNDE